MTLPKEALHSPSMEKVLEEIGENLDTSDGILPQDMTSEDLHLLYELGFNLYQAKDYEKGEEVFRRLVIAKPFESKHWRGLASCLQMKKNYENALISWGMWCLVDPENPLPHFHAAECLFSSNQVNEAAKALDAAEARDSEKHLAGRISALRTSWGINGGM